MARGGELQRWRADLTEPRAAGDALLADVPAGLRGAAGQEAREIGYVAVALEQRDDPSTARMPTPA